MILTGTRAVLSVTLYREGVATDPDADETATCTIRDAAGEVVLTGNATRVGGNSGRLTFAWTAATNTRPRKVTVTWGNIVFSDEPAIEVVQDEESVGELLFTENEARLHDDEAIEDDEVYTAAAVREKRAELQERFGEIIGVSLGLRGTREVLSGDGSRRLSLSRWPVHRVRSISVRTRGTQTWTAFTEAELADVLVERHGLIERESLGAFASGRQNIAVEYEHGLQPIPGDLRTAGLDALRMVMVPSNIPDQSLFLTTEMGQFRLAVADAMRSHWFGVPKVDSVLQHYRAKYRVPGVG
jgi:hypothetical protein